MTILSPFGRSPRPFKSTRQRGAIRPLVLAFSLLACSPASAEVFDWSDYLVDEENVPPGSIFNAAGVDLTLNWWTVNEDGSPFRAHNVDPEHFVTFESSFVGGELRTLYLAITAVPLEGDPAPVQNADRLILEWSSSSPSTM